MSRHIEWGMAAEAGHRLIDNSEELFEGESVAPFNNGLLITTPDGNGIVLEGQPDELMVMLFGMLATVTAQFRKEAQL